MFKKGVKKLYKWHSSKMLYSLQVCPIKVQLQTFLDKLISRNLGFDSIH